MQVCIEKIIYPGRSLATYEGKVILTDEGLPGEMVEVQYLKEKKSYIEAKTSKIIQASPQRTKTRCSHYQACSLYQYIDYPFQAEIKKSQLQEIFWHELKTELSQPEFIASPKIWEYRNKVKLHIIQEKNRNRLAYHIPGSQNEWFPVEECFLIPERMNSLLRDFISIIDENKLLGTEEVEVKESASSQEMLLILHGRKLIKTDSLSPFLSRLQDKYPLAGVVGQAKAKGKNEEFLIWGKNFIEERICEISFQIGAQSFFQVNSLQLQKLIMEMKDSLQLEGRERIADLYCGLGTFGMALASQALKVYGVESSVDNISFLKKNLSLNHITNFTVCEGTSEEWVERLLDKKIDIVILDPPRKGLNPAVIQNLIQKPVPVLIYLSCNPSTLARDLKLFFRAYILRNIRIYDFFPHTPHIETCTLLTKK